MYDILTLIFALIALGLLIYKTWFSWRDYWKGGFVIVGTQAVEIIKSDKHTLTVDSPFEASPGDETFLIVPPIKTKKGKGVS